jgi:hypothetical protein
MRDEQRYRTDRGFSPRVLTLLTDGFGRHGADVADLSNAFKQRVRRMARDAEEARELARLCSAMQQLSDRIVSDALTAKVELARLAPHAVTLSICRCGRSIEDGACPTRGQCTRGSRADITA